MPNYETKMVTEFIQLLLLPQPSSWILSAIFRGVDMSKLSMFDRRKLAEMIDQDLPRTEIARLLSVSRPTIYKWSRLYEEDGIDALTVTRSSAPHTSPQKIDPILRRRIIKLAWRHPDEGLNWYFDKICQQTSITTIHAVLKQSGLGSKKRRLARVLLSHYKSSRASLIHSQCKKFPALLNCFQNQKWFSKKPRAEFIGLYINQPVRYSRRMVKLFFLLDTYNYSASVVIDPRRFFTLSSKISLGNAQCQNGYTELEPPEIPQILTWNIFLNQSRSVTTTHLILPYVREEDRPIYNALSSKLETSAISTSFVLRKHLIAIPWVELFINQWKIFQNETLNSKMFYDRYERRNIVLQRGTDLLEVFLDQYNHRAIDIFPFFSESPDSFKKAEKGRAPAATRVANLTDLIATVE